MAEPRASAGQRDDVPIEPDEIQFDQAEYATTVPSGPICGACQQAIADEYYEINGKIVCSSCRHRVEAALRGGSRLGRFLKSFFLGSAAAAIGAVIYYAILRATGYNIGLVAVVVGAMVGGAVRKGTGNRGGRLYQALAVFLTYSAIAAMYVPFLFQGIADAREKDQQAKLAAEKAEKGPAKPQAPAAVANESSKLKVGDRQGPAGAKAVVKDSAEGASEEIAAVKNREAIVDDAMPPAKKKPVVVLVSVLIALVFLTGLVYTIPVQLALGDPMSGLIFGFALWEAWKLNKGVHWSFEGPFRVGKQDPNGPASEVGDGG